jgi:hypothetical protein
MLVAFAVAFASQAPASSSEAYGARNVIEQWRVTYEQSAPARTAAEHASERGWLAAPTTPCEAFGQGTEPQVCIEHLGPESIPIGTAVVYRLRWRNLPRGAHVRVGRRNAAPLGERWRYSGAPATIAIPTPVGSAAGDVRLTWSGRSILCERVRPPCDVGEVGRYVLRATIQTRDDTAGHHLLVATPEPAVYHARSETRPFTLDGPPQPVARQFGYRYHPASQEIAMVIEEALPAGALGVDSYVQRRLPWLGPWRVAGPLYCARLDLDWPLAGWTRICFPRSRRDANGIALRPGDFTATSSARMVGGLIRARDAVAKATAYAIQMTGGQATFSEFPSEEEMARVLQRDRRTHDGSYQGMLNAARDARLTYVEVNQPTPSLRDDPDGSWWLVNMSLWIGTINGPRTAEWGRFALRVDHDGHVCRVDVIETPAGHDRSPGDASSGCRPGSRRRM